MGENEFKTQDQVQDEARGQTVYRLSIYEYVGQRKKNMKEHFFETISSVYIIHICAYAVI